MNSRRLLAIAVLAAACDHSDGFVSHIPPNGPFSAGSEIRLTFNIEQDYWPTLSEDGGSIVYAFVNVAQRDLIPYGHRCIGLMPVAGGTRSWEWCDNRAEMQDSLTSFPAFAIGADGRLLYVEAAVGQNRFHPVTPTESSIWLADTTHPFRRRLLARLPVIIGDSSISWLGDLSWTGPMTFLALGQHFLPASHCVSGPPMDCSRQDSIFYGEMIVRGEINATGAVFSPIAGTEGATSYSRAENGSSIVFTRRDSTMLYRVPASGGPTTTVGIVTARVGVQLMGTSCRASFCVVALGPVTLWRPAFPDTAIDIATVNSGVTELRRVSLVDGSSTALLSRPSQLLSSPLLLPNGDVIAQLGRMMGHLQTFSDSSDLYLFHGVAQ